MYLAIMNHKYLPLLAGFLSCNAAFSQVTNEIVQDGPYIFYTNNDPSAYQITNDAVITLKNPGAFAVQFQDPAKNFNVQLKPITTEPSEFPLPSKLFVVSDIEGEFDLFRKLLINNKVINEKYEWTFGDGHLVVCGDLFDRGKQVSEYLWLLYMLEQKAKSKGGYVHTILGNHDIMNLSGDYRYVQPKYFNIAKLLQKEYRELFDNNTELGRWLRSKNIIEKIGPYLFLHGGIAPEIIKEKWSMATINKLARPYYDQPHQSIPDSLQVLLGKDGLFWYRGYFEEPKTPASEIDNILQYFNAEKIIVGHTILPENISKHYGGKVIAVDVNYHEGESQALLIEGKTCSIADVSGNRKPL
jgi:hypothetical protein